MKVFEGHCQYFRELINVERAIFNPTFPHVQFQRIQGQQLITVRPLSTNCVEQVEHGLFHPHTRGIDRMRLRYILEELLLRQIGHHTAEKRISDIVSHLSLRM